MVCQIFLYSNMSFLSPSLSCSITGLAISGKTLADFHHSPISRHLSLLFLLSHISISCNCSPHAFPSVFLLRLIMLGQEINMNNTAMLSDSSPCPSLHYAQTCSAVQYMFIILISAVIHYLYLIGLSNY